MAAVYHDHYAAGLHDMGGGAEGGHGSDRFMTGLACVNQVSLEVHHDGWSSHSSRP